jgi:hypothetical protein
LRSVCIACHNAYIPVAHQGAVGELGGDQIGGRLFAYTVNAANDSLNCRPIVNGGDLRRAGEAWPGKAKHNEPGNGNGIKILLHWTYASSLFMADISPAVSVMDTYTEDIVLCLCFAGHRSWQICVEIKPAPGWHSSAIVLTHLWLASAWM